MEFSKIILGEKSGTAKIVIQGKSEVRDTYRVDINKLFYNDKNGRISTFMAEYKARNIEEITSFSREEYNDKIMSFIINSESPSSYKTTKDNIELVGQMVPGIILTDGRVIDGNRRFTILRDLYRETHLEKYRYFDCFVIDAPKNKEDRMAIKSLELMAQYGTDSKVDYNPIDRLADIYNDLINEKLFTPEEYASRLGNTVKVNDVKKQVDNAQTMWDFLEFIGFEGRWDYARDKKLDGPVVELTNLRRRVGESEWMDINHLFFMYLKGINDGDKTREIRKIVKSYRHDKSKFLNLSEKAFDVYLQEEQLARSNNSTDNSVAKREFYETRQSLNKSIEHTITETNLNAAREKQLKDLNDIYSRIEKIDRYELRNVNKELKKEISNTLEKIKNYVLLLEDDVNES